MPVVAMFHTLGALKNRVADDSAELEQQIRVDIERRTMATADRIVAATDVDRSHMLERTTPTRARSWSCPAASTSTCSAPAIARRRGARSASDRSRCCCSSGGSSGSRGSTSCSAPRPSCATTSAACACWSSAAPATSPDASARRRPASCSACAPSSTISISSGVSSSSARSTAAPARLLPRGRRHGHAVDLRVVRPGRRRVDGLRHARRGFARRRAGDDRSRRRERRAGAVA